MRTCVEHASSAARRAPRRARRPRVQADRPRRSARPTVQHRVERGHRLLEDHRDLGRRARAASALARSARKVDAVEPDRSAAMRLQRLRQQAHDATAPSATCRSRTRRRGTASRRGSDRKADTSSSTGRTAPPASATSTQSRCRPGAAIGPAECRARSLSRRRCAGSRTRHTQFGMSTISLMRRSPQTEAQHVGVDRRQAVLGGEQVDHADDRFARARSSGPGRCRSSTS